MVKEPERAVERNANSWKVACWLFYSSKEVQLHEKTIDIRDILFTCVETSVPMCRDVVTSQISPISGLNMIPLPHVTGHTRETSSFSCLMFLQLRSSVLHILKNRGAKVHV